MVEDPRQRRRNQPRPDRDERFDYGNSEGLYPYPPVGFGPYLTPAGYYGPPGWNAPGYDDYYRPARSRAVADRGHDRDYRGQDRDFWDKAGDEVASWFGDEAADMRREEDQRGKGPKGYARSDARIHEDVCDALMDDRLVDASDIEVEVRDGEVSLSGTVASRAARRHAEDCADNVRGVRFTQNNLRLAETMP